MMNLESRLTNIEMTLEQIMASLGSSQWVAVTEAAAHLNIHHTLLRRIIKKSMTNPSKSDLKYGVHYRKIEGKYQCNIKALDSYFNKL